LTRWVQQGPVAAAPASPAPGFALWNLGFRPFYLAASLFAALSIALWAAQYRGWLGVSYLPGPVWHAHEMVFGFAMAVIAGFLFTAVRNWTNQPTPTGTWLAGIVALWAAGRILVLTPWGTLSAIVNAAFLLAVAAGIGIPLAKSGNQRNYFFVALLVIAAAASLYVHLSLAHGWALPPWLGIRLALDVVLLIMSVMAGRVVPMFTANAIPGAGSRRNIHLERAALAVIVVLGVFDALGIDGSALAVLALTGAAIHAVRWWLWAPARTLRVPLVWVLHAGYAWIPIYFVLRAGAAMQLLPSPLAVHALTVGAIGGLTIGMMTRTAKGHTGRPLLADAADAACYVLVLAAAVVRVFVPLLLPQAYPGCIVLSAVLWSAGYALYAIRYWPLLTRPRADGRPG
jgi:uncharacterized protein involved in response to NO